MNARFAWSPTVMNPNAPQPGRGATANPDSRYAAHQREAVDDGWPADEAAPPLRTQVGLDASRTVISYNPSPDIPFDRSLNPYRGCEHGCIYCYARPSHAWLGLSPGLDFETRLFCKPDAAAQLERELAAPGYRPAPLALGANTDPYQPIERRYQVTRAASILIRLPLEIADLFEAWLREHYPQRADKVLSLIRQCRGGRLNDPEFGARMTGRGPVADLLDQRLRLAARRLGLDGALDAAGSGWDLDCTRFRRPRPIGTQFDLFDEN